MNKLIGLLLVVILQVLPEYSNAASQELRYQDLTDRYFNLERLAQLPQSGETTGLWSSYDRSSKYLAETDSYVGWYAMDDGEGYIRKLGDSYVLAEMTGPGCLWRIWSAAPGSGHVKIYLDESSTPVIDLPFKAYFDLQHAPFLYQSLIQRTSNGLTALLPIPYQRSCLIVAEPGWGAYYQFGFSSFPQDTSLQTFSLPLPKESQDALLLTDSLLKKNDYPAYKGSRKQETTLEIPVVLQPQSRTTVVEFAGPRTITAFKVRLQDEPPDNSLAWIARKLGFGAEPQPKTSNYYDEIVWPLREVCLQLTWDHAALPAVWTPLGDFFGTAPGINQYRSWIMGMSNGEFYAYWVMPFKTHAKVELVNEGNRAVSLTVVITHEPLAQETSDLGYFHAKWHRDAFLPTAKGRQDDWTFLRTTGRGRFCGMMLHVWNPQGGWWGEGDEKIYLDGEKFPSLFGTGTDDYFGYSWGKEWLFQTPFRNLTLCENNQGHISANRWHVFDSIPFQTSFEGSIEKYFSNDRPTNYTAVAYWYLDPHGDDPYQPAPVKDRTTYFDPPKIYTITGALEAERLKVIKSTGGKIQVQEMWTVGENWSGGAHLLWTEGLPGDMIVLQIPNLTKGTYTVKVQTTEGENFGQALFFLDGDKIGETVECYSRGIKPSGAYTLGSVSLDEGSHWLTVELSGVNPRALRPYALALDWVAFELLSSSAP